MRLTRLSAKLGHIYLSDYQARSLLLAQPHCDIMSKSHVVQDRETLSGLRAVPMRITMLMLA